MNTFLKVYKNTVSKLLVVLFGSGCRFTPTCSEYFAEAVENYGIVKGSFLGIKRIGRCHPFGGSGYDPVPKH